MREDIDRMDFQTITFDAAGLEQEGTEGHLPMSLMENNCKERRKRKWKIENNI